MIKQSYPTQKPWHQHIQHLPKNLAPYVLEAGSLTAKLRATGAALTVQLIQQIYAQCLRDNRPVLGLTAKQSTWQRDVVLHLDGMPVVYAHTCIAQANLNGVWRRLMRLGRRPLGELLFSTPAIMRAPLEYALLDSRHPLYQRVLAAGLAIPKQLWARRSCFVWHGQPLLVTEVFLPNLERFSAC